MQSTSFSRSKPPELCSIDSIVLTQGEISQCPSEVNFPLVSRSNDPTNISLQMVTSDCKLYLELLKAVSSSKSSFHHDKISPDIVNRLDKSQGASPLHYACINGNLLMVNFLLENGAEMDIWDENKKATPLICCAAYGHLDIVKKLLEFGCDVNAGLHSSIEGQDCALLWAVRNTHEHVVLNLLNHDASQTSTVAFSETPLHAAVSRGSPQILKMLISAQDANIKSDFQMGQNKNSPLHMAASGAHKNSLELCKILVEDGNAYINSRNAHDRTPLHEAIISQNVDITKYLLSRFAKTNAVDKDGRTPLFFTISDDEEALQILELLIEISNVNHQDKLGHTPLHLAGICNAVIATEILLMNGADFSIKTNGGASALSILRKKIPTTFAILDKVFDQAVAPSNYETSFANSRQDSNKVEVDFTYVLPAPITTTVECPVSSLKEATENSQQQHQKPFSISRMTSIFKDVEEEISQESSIRKETSKVKCLVDEGYSSLLVHPVIHSFLELKWHNSRCILFPTLTFKIMLVLLFSVYVQIPIIIANSLKLSTLNATAATTIKALDDVVDNTPGWFTGMYAVIVCMAGLQGLIELKYILRAPRQQLKTFHPWIAFAVLLIMVFYMSPGDHWENVYKVDPFEKSMTALGILLAWMDVWIDMGRFPKIGLSIRVFMKVLNNFSLFILPHCCLLIGFIIAFTLLFPESGEFQSLAMGLPKVIRVMAGDITIVSPGSNVVEPDSEDGAILSHFLLVYIYTAYVLMVAIVLMNLLIGLAVNDIQKIYTDAAADTLAKQVILLNTLETSFHGRWVIFCLPRRLFTTYVNLFPTKHGENKIITFDDSRDWKLGSGQKKELLRIASVKRVSDSQKDNPISPISPVPKSPFPGKLNKTYTDDEQRALLENINKLVMTYLGNKTAKTSNLPS